MPSTSPPQHFLCSGAACCATVGLISTFTRATLVILSVAKDLNRSIVTPQNWSWILESRTAA